MDMDKIRNFDADTREFFDSLPKFVQEDIMQSDLEIRNKKDLEQFVDSFCRGGTPEWK